MAYSEALPISSSDWAAFEDKANFDNTKWDNIGAEDENSSIFTSGGAHFTTMLSGEAGIGRNIREMHPENKSGNQPDISLFMNAAEISSFNFGNVYYNYTNMQQLFRESEADRGGGNIGTFDALSDCEYSTGSNLLDTLPPAARGPHQNPGTQTSVSQMPWPLASFALPSEMLSDPQQHDCMQGLEFPSELMNDTSPGTSYKWGCADGFHPGIQLPLYGNYGPVTDGHSFGPPDSLWNQLDSSSGCHSVSANVSRSTSDSSIPSEDISNRTWSTMSYRTDAIPDGTILPPSRTHSRLVTTTRPKGIVRRRFRPEEKKAVALVRVIGACILCKSNKAKCSGARTCKPCAQRLGSLGLARNVCLRQGIKAFRKDLTDLFDTASERTVVPRRFYGPTRTLVLGFAYQESNEMHAVFPGRIVLKIEIQERDLSSALSRNFLDDHPYYKDYPREEQSSDDRNSSDHAGMTEKDSEHTTEDFEPGSSQDENRDRIRGISEPLIQRQGLPTPSHCQQLHSTVSSSYAIVPSTLPTFDHLDEWGKQFIEVDYSLFPDDLDSILDLFLLRFSSAEERLPMQSFAKLTLRIVSLSRWIFYQHAATYLHHLKKPAETTLEHLPVFTIVDDQIKVGLSEVARTQLFVHAVKGIEETEGRILSIFDELMKVHGPSHQQAVIIGICLRRLGLLYRKRAKRYKYHNIERMRRRFEKPKAMYEALTAAYSAVYRGTASPYSPSWRIEDYLDVFGEKDVANLFNLALTADKQFCEGHLHDEDDVHHRKLFLERREREGQRRTTTTRT